MVIQNKASKRALTLEEVLTQVLASDSDKSDIEIESDDSYDQEEDFQTNINQCFENFDEEEPVPSDSMFDVSDSNPDLLDPAPLDNHKLLIYVMLNLLLLQMLSL